MVFGVFAPRDLKRLWNEASLMSKGETLANFLQRLSCGRNYFFRQFFPDSVEGSRDSESFAKHGVKRETYFQPTLEADGPGGNSRKFFAASEQIFFASELGTKSYLFRQFFPDSVEGFRDAESVAKHGVKRETYFQPTLEADGPGGKLSQIFRGL